MPADILEKLFGSSARVKIIRLFLINSQEIFTPKEVSRRCKVSSASLRREISLLKSIGLIKQKSSSIDEAIKLKNGKIKNKKKRIKGFILNELFPLIHPLKNLVVDSAPFSKERMVKSLKSAGKVKLILLSGIFLNSDSRKSDIVLVGDSVRKSNLEKILRKIEAELGQEIIYTLFDTKEFMYRFSMYDRFLRDILDNPHEKPLDKLGI